MDLSPVIEEGLTNAEKLKLKSMQKSIEAFKDALDQMQVAIMTMRVALEEVMRLPVVARLQEIENRYNKQAASLDESKKALMDHITKLRHAFPFL